MDVKRRSLFGTIAAGAAGAAAASLPAGAQMPPAPAAKPAVVPPSSAVGAAETEKPLTPREAELVGRTGSDFMVDVLKALQFDYVATMPGSTFRGLHESLINYGGNKAPELLTCLHEEVAVGMCHGYGKVAHKPMAALLHGVVGVQHGAMAIYNCWADRAPAYVMIGNTAALEERRPGAEWAHSAQDNAAMIRDYVKWDDQPASLPHFAQSAVRAYKQMMTPPMAPVALVVDGEMSERSIGAETWAIPGLGARSLPVGDPAALLRVAKLLVAAEAPVLVLDRCVRSEQGLASVVALAEALGCAVIDKGARLNMPTRHPLNQTARARAVLADADVVLGIEVSDLYGVLHSYRDRIHRDEVTLTKPGVKVVSLSIAEMLIKSNYQDFQRLEPADITILGDGETSLPLLLEAIRASLPQSSIYADRARKLADAGRGLENTHIGTTIDTPNIDFAKLASSMGVWSEGPIEDPAKLGPAIARAVAVVKSGAPALLDVVCQPR